MIHGRIITLSVCTLLLTACGGGGSGGGNPGNANASTNTQLSTAARTSVLAANDPACPNGGILVETGIDSNGNGTLETNEVDSA